MDFPIKNCIFHSHISLPEGKTFSTGGFFQCPAVLPGARHANDAALAPAAVRALQGRAHDLHIPSASGVGHPGDNRFRWIWPENGGCWIRGIMNSLYIQYIPIYIPILGWLKCYFLGYLMSLIQFDPHRSLSRGLVQGNCHVETAMVFCPSNIGASCKTMGDTTHP